MTDNHFDETTKCPRCGEDRIIIRRGLCSDCILEEVEAGTLDKNYPPRDDREKHDEVQEQEQEVNQEEKAMSRGANDKKQYRSTRACLKCGQMKMIIGRGLCPKCYSAERTSGTLDKNFPKARKVIPGVDTAKPRRIAKPEAKRRIVIPCGLHAADDISAGQRPVVQADGLLKQRAEEALHPGRRLLLAALDAIGELAEAVEHVASSISGNGDLVEHGDRLRSSAQIGYAAIGRLTREARKDNVL